MEQAAVLEYQQQEELEDFIYRAAFLLADVGFFQEPAYTKLPDGISKPALNFRVVISVSMVYHKIGTFLRYFFDFANLIIPENRCFLLSMYKYICIQSQKFKGFQLVWSVGSLSYYLYLAIKENIEFVVLGKLTQKMPLEMFDITTLMGNILQNAVEAAVKADVPKIRVELIEHKKEIFIVVSNSVAKKINTKTDFFMTSKKDKENHGFGLKNIAATVEKYHGECYMESIVENRETLFKISIAIPTAKAEEKEE